MINKKRILTIFLCLLMVICSIFSFAACNDEDDPKSITSISVVYTPGEEVVDTNTSLDELKDSIVVTLQYSDGTTETITDYALSGTLSEGESVITVSYKGFEKTFTVNVSEALDASHSHTLVRNEAKTATCTIDGNIEYWSCSSCGKHYADQDGVREIALSETVITASHNLTHHEAKTATCSENGNIEYWSCSACSKNYSNANATTEASNTVIEAAHTGGTEIRNSKSPSETEEGYTGDTYCLGCGEKIATGETIDKLGHTHALTKTNATLATCTENGNIEYWSCSSCGKYYADQNGETEITISDTIIAASHTGGTEIRNSKAPSESEEGYTGDTYCLGCGEKIATGETIDKLDHTHVMTKTNSKNATCTENGNIEYWSCSSCGKYYADQDGIREITLSETAIAASHNLTYHEAKTATCTVDGNIEYWSCSACNKNYSDANATTEVDTVVVAASHNLTHHEAKAATCTVDGNIEYWYCSACHKSYSNANATTEVTDTVIEAAHTGGTEIRNSKAPSESEEGYTGDTYCLGCGEKIATGETIDKLDHTHVMTKTNRKEATCTADGNIEYWSCSSCGKHYADQDGVREIAISETVIAASHNLTHHEAKAATCTVDGNIEYWSCSVCNKNYSDANATTEVDTVVIAASHNLTHHEAKSATCTVDGNIEYWSCSVCNKNYSDANATTEVDTVVVAASHSLTHHEAKTATCTVDGNIEYWSCSACNKNYSDANATAEVATVVIAASHSLTHHEAKTATCTEDGNIEYWSCSVCNKNYSDANATTEVDTVVVAASHSLTHHEAKPATCGEAGNVEYWSCSLCNKNYADANATAELDDVIVTVEHNLTHHEAKTATCTENGNIEYWSCSVCNKNYSDANATAEVTTVVIVASHSLTHHESKTATCTEDGNIEYWSCSVCNKNYSDENATTEVANVVTTTDIHSYSAEWSTNRYYHWHATTCGHDAKSDYAEHTFTDGKCTVCQMNEILETQGLEFTLNSDMVSYSVTGMGTATDVNMIIPSSYNGYPVTGIGSSAFSGYTALLSVELPSSLKTIASNAFQGCTGLTSIVLPESTTTISSSAFKNCTGLTEIVVPDSVTSIGSAAFSGCTSLTSITLPFVGGSVKSSSDTYQYPFGYIFGTSSYTGGTSTQQYYYGSSTTSTTYSTYYIPTSLTNVTITGGNILYGAFYNCKVSNITIGDSITSIAASSFYGCSSLKELTIPFVGGSASATSASSSTLFGYIFGTTSYSGGTSRKQYYSASSYATYYIPTSLKTVTVTGGEILYGAFYNCANLTKVNLPETITTIGERAFNSCTSLTSVNIPETITTISPYAFCGCAGLLSITIPENVTTIGNYAFYNCKALTSIYFNATAMEDLSSYNYVFYQYERIGTGATVTVGANVTKIPAYLFAPYYSGSGSPSYYPNITTLVFEENSICESIGNYAFAGCINLASVQIPSTIKKLGSHAFYYCENLENLYIYDLESWCNIDFYNYESYSLVCNNPMGNASNIYLNGELLTNLIIPESVTNIGDFTFYGCNNLTSITIHEKVTSIGKAAFAYCSNLEEIIFNATTVEDFDSSNYVFYNAGSNAEGIEVSIGANVTKIPAYLFRPYSSSSTSYSPNIVKVVFEENSVCESIGSGAFGDCVNLVSINLPESLTSIGASAFYDCSSLTTIVIPKNVTSIGSGALAGCSSLTSVTLPFIGASIKTSTDTYQYPLGYIFGTSSYDGATATQQYFYGSSTSSTTYSTYYIPTTLTSVTINGGNVLYGAFYNCSNITTIALGDSVTSIATSAFKNCTNISSITIGKNIASIGSSAFAECSSLTSVHINDLESWCEIAFANASANPLYCGGNLYLDGELVTKLDLQNSEITKIGAYAFYGYSPLTSITIPESVTSIGNYAFYNCVALGEIHYNAANVNDLYSSNYIFYCAGQESEGIAVTFGEKVTKIPAYLFYPYSTSSCLPNIASVEFAEGCVCTSIGAYAFYNSKNITSVTIPDTTVTIGNYAFYNCSAITDMSLGNSVKTIGAYAFYSCSSIETVEIPNSTTSIGERAFYGCSSLKDLTIGEGVTSIGTYAFYNCSSVESIEFNAKAMNDLAESNYIFYYIGSGSTGVEFTIGKNVTKIPAYLFGGSYSNIKTVRFEAESACTSIGNNAFSNCSNIDSVYITDVAKWCGITFGNSNANPLCVAGNLYLNNVLVTALVIPHTVTTINPYTFYGCTSVINVTVPSSVTKIDSNAFSGCRKLVEICNLSALTITAGSSNNGSVGYYAKNIYTSTEGASKLVNQDDYIFYCDSENNEYLLVGYIGNNTELTLPASVNGQNYKIYQYAFYHCTNITSVTIPNTVTNIDSYMFYKCTGLVSVTIPGSVKTIGDYAFNGCKNLANVTISSGVENIGACAFSGCVNLSTLSLPESVTTIGNSAFSGCSKLTTITIPNSIKSIGNYAFDNCTNLTYAEYDNAYYLGNESNPYLVLVKAKDNSIESCTINENTKIIYYRAFYRCESLTDISIPNNVTAIGDYAFYECTNLANVAIGTGVQSIGSYSFYECTSLASLTIPNNVTTIGSNVFSYCSALTEVTIGNGLEIVGSSAFSNCTALTDVVIGEGVKTIGSSAFYYCTALETITIPSGITKIESNAFYNCTALKTINFNATEMEDLGSYNYTFYRAGQNGDGITVVIGKNVTKIPAYLFQSYSSTSDTPKIVSVKFAAESVCVSIGANAFGYCGTLTDIAIPDSVTSIGNAAFYYCNGLKSITIPENVSVIGTSAFYNCTALEEIYFNAKSVEDFVSSNQVFSNAGTSGEGIKVVIGSSVTKIPAYLFYPYNSSYNPYTPKITSVEFAENSSCKTIGDYSFYKCTELTSVSFPVGVTSIGNYAFYNCTELTSITIPNTVESIGNYAFYNCPGLKTVVIPNGVKTIGDNAFYGCTELVSIEIPNSVTSIGNSAFYGCTNLTSIVIPDSVTSIGSSAFNGCSKLASISIPDGIQTIGNYAFGNCTSLVYNEYDNGYYLGNDSNPYVVFVKVKDTTLTTCQIHADTKIIYYQAFYNCTNLTSVNIPDGVISIGEYAFYNCVGLNSITIPDTVTSIGAYAFDECENIVSVTIGKGLKNVGSYAFSDCSKLEAVNISDIGSWSSIMFNNSSANPLYYAENLYLNGILVTSITLPDTVTSIGSYTFYSYDKLTHVVIPNRVTSIGANAFSGCEGLKSVTIGNGIETVGSNAFDDCDNLKAVYITDIANWCSISFGNSYANPLYYASNLYLNGTLVTTLIVPDSVTSIGAYTFYNCKALMSVTIGKNVESIGTSAFQGCYKLIEVCNLSVLTITAGETNNGYVGYYAKNVYTPESASKLVNKDDYIFYCDSESNEYYLVGYIGNSKVLNLPSNINGNDYAIYQYAFYNCTDITSVIIPEGVNAIGTYAFYNCVGLKSLTIGEDVASIGNYAFYNCYALESISFNATTMENLSSSNRVFYCAGQNGNGINVTIGANVTKIPAYLFNPYSSSSSAPKVISVEFAENSECIEIGTSAFEYCQELSSIVIPNKVTSIGSSAFENCINLASVTLGNSVETIGSYAFYECSSLSSIIIPNSVKTIGSNAFYNCTGLTNVTIGENVESIASSAFRYCYKLIEVYNLSKLEITTGSTNNGYVGYYAKNVYTVTDGASKIVNQDGYIFSYDSTSNTYYLVGYVGSANELVLPESINGKSYTIYQYAFYENTGITKVTISDGVDGIDSYAFYRCSNLSILVIGKNVNNIGAYAFYECENLSSVSIPEKVTNIGEYAFYGCTALTSVTIGNGVTSIGNYAFYGCTEITTLTIGEKVESIGNYAFNNCKSINTIVIPDSVTSIGSYAFASCTGLSNITIGNGVTTIGNYSFNNCTSLTNVVIPDSVTSIGADAFYGCTGLKSITIGKGVTNIGSYAFYNCTALEEIYFNATTMADLSSSNRVFYNAGKNGDGIKVIIGANVTKIPAYLFYPYSSTSYLPKIASIEFAEGSVCTSIGNYAFYGCSGITTLILPDAVTAIGSYAFYDNENLSSLTLGSEVESIGDCAFAYCSSLTSVSLPETLTSIGNSAFSYCGLTSVVIPKNVTTVGTSAFAGCSALSNVEWKAINCTTAGSSSSPIFSNCAMLSSITFGSEVTMIPAYLCYSCSGLTSVVIPSGITSIGTQAFYNCYKLVEVYNLSALEVVIGETSNGYVAYYALALHDEATDTSCLITYEDFVFVDTGDTLSLIAYLGTETEITLPNYNNRSYSINRYAFYNNTTLTKVIMPDNVISIDEYAFYNCRNITEITISNSITTIGNYAFYGCYGITSITLPNTLTSIGDNAFYGCRGLTEIVVPQSVTTIGSAAFGNCGSLQRITLPFVGGSLDATSSSATTLFGYIFGTSSYTGGVSTKQYYASSSYKTYYIPSSLKEVTILDGNIYYGAFYGCTNINTIKIMEDVESIGKYAFYNCTGLNTLYYNAEECADFGSSSYVFYNAGTAGDGIAVTIGAKAKSVPAYMFYPYSSSYAPKLLSVEFEEGSICESIGTYAFYNCTSLNSVEMPDTLLSIGDRAFYGCTGLTTVKISSGLTTVGTYAFYNCSSLTSITIPEKVTSIGKYAFYGCTALSEINYNAEACADFGSGNYIFYNAGTSGEGITVTIGSTVKSIPTYFFYPYSTYTPNIASISFAEGSVCETIGMYAFYNCSKITSIELPTSLISIGNYAFYGCSGLTTVVVAENVTSIGNAAFGGCGALESITLPFVGGSATAESASSSTLFGYIFGTSSYTGGTSTSQYYASSSYTRYYIPATLKEVTITGGDLFYGAFYGCSNLTNVVIRNANTIGEKAFYGCSALESITLPFVGGSATAESPSASTLFGYIFGTSSYTGGTATTQNYSSSVTYYIPTTLKKVTITGGNILYGAFYGCSGLTDINLTGTVESIGNRAFYGCSGLVNLNMPEELTSIGSYAFYNCSSLTSITIPQKVASIGNNAFQGCTAVSHIYYLAESCADMTSGNYVFYNVGTSTDGIAVIIGKNVKSVPAYLFYPYNASNTLNIVSFAFETGSTCTNVGNYAFYGFKNISSISLPQTLNSIGDYAFYGWSSLKNIVVPASVTSIGNTAFGGCGTLESITLPFVGGSATAESASASTLFGYVFGTSSYTGGVATKQYYDASSYVTYYIPATLSEVTITGGNIFYGAFYNCSNIEFVYTPEGLSISDMGDKAFWGCSGWCNATEEHVLMQNSDKDIVKENIVASSGSSTGTYDENIYCDICGNLVVSNTITVPLITIYENDTGNIGATGLTNISVLNTSVVSLSSSGVLTPRGVGKTLVTATTAEGEEVSYIVMILDDYLTATLNSTTLYVTQTANISVSVSRGSYTFSSSNTSVATVSSSGRITAVASGSATITITGTNGEKTTKYITVKANSITISESSVSIIKGNTHSLSVTTTISDSVTWSSSDTSIVRVSSNGTLTAVSAGTATITAKSSKCGTVTCTVTVKLETVTVTRSNYSNYLTVSVTCPRTYESAGYQYWTYQIVITVKSGYTVSETIAINLKDSDGKTITAYLYAGETTRTTTGNSWYYCEYYFPSGPSLSSSKISTVTGSVAKN